jgi:flagellar hook-length control protein FliK
MPNASNILSAIVPVSGTAPGGNISAAPALQGIALGQSSEFAALLATQQNGGGALEALTALEVPEVAEIAALAASGVPAQPLPIANSALNAGRPQNGNLPTATAMPTPAQPQDAFNQAPIGGTIPVLPESANAQGLKFAASGESPAPQPQPGIQALPETAKPQPAAPSAPVRAGLVAATDAPAMPAPAANGNANSSANAVADTVIPSQTAALAENVPPTPGAMLQNAQAAANGRPASARPGASTPAGHNAAAQNALAANVQRGPANPLQQHIQRDEASDRATATATANARLAQSIMSTSSPMALSVSHTVVSNVAASVPAGGTGAAAADTLTLMSAQNAIQAQMGETVLAGGGAGTTGGNGNGTNPGGEFVPGGPTLTVNAQAPQPVAHDGEFTQLAHQAAGNGSSVEQAFKPATAATTGGAHHAQPHATPHEQIAVQIGLAARFGAKQISLQLRPASLGEVEIDLNIANDGQVRATVLAERQETLDLLQRDARGLEKALQDAGLKSDSGSLQFGLRGEGREQRQHHAHGDAYRSHAALMADGDSGDGALASARVAASYNSATDSALDIRV